MVQVMIVNWWDHVTIVNVLIPLLSSSMVQLSKDTIVLIIDYCRTIPRIRQVIGTEKANFSHFFDGNVDLGFVLSKNTQIINLTITSNTMKLDDAKEFGEGLKRNKTIERVALKGNPFDEAVINILSMALTYNDTLKLLTLNKESIPIDKFRDDQVRNLDLSKRRYHNHSAIVIANFLESNAALVKLNLEGNKIGNRGFQFISRALKKNTTLQELNVGGNRTGDAITHLLKGLERNETLMRLNIGRNRIGKVGAIVIANFLYSNPALVELNLQGNEIGNLGFHYISMSLQKNKTLKELNVGGNRIGDDGIVSLWKGLECNTVLDKLIIGSDYWKNYCGPHGASVLGKLLKKGHFMQLSLSCNEIGDKGTQAIGLGLATNTMIKKIDLSCARVGDNGALVLIEGLRENSTITDLSLVNNILTDVSGRKLAHWIIKNHVIRKLFLNANMMGDATAEAFANALKYNTLLRTLILAGNKYGGRWKRDLKIIGSQRGSVDYRF